MNPDVFLVITAESGFIDSVYSSRELAQGRISFILEKQLYRLTVYKDSHWVISSWALDAARR